MITTEFKQKVIEALKTARENFDGSDARFAVSIGISGSQYSRVKNGETDRVISDAAWLTLARRYDVSGNNGRTLKLTKTPVFQFITAQIEACQQNSISYMLCDWSDIGKTVAAKEYCRTHKNAVYIDCSQVKAKQLFIRQISKEFGLGREGRYYDVYNNLAYYLRALPEPPIIVMDEWGDVSYETFMEAKALWNAVDPYCSFYAIGAEGLEEKMRRGISNKKVGYTEMFRRFSKKYGKVEDSTRPKDIIIEETALLIIKANAPSGSDYNMILRNTMGEDGRPSLTRISNELAKHK